MPQVYSVVVAMQDEQSLQLGPRLKGVELEVIQCIIGHGDRDDILEYNDADFKQRHKVA